MFLSALDVYFQGLDYLIKHFRVALLWQNACTLRMRYRSLPYLLLQILPHFSRSPILITFSGRNPQNLTLVLTSRKIEKSILQNKKNGKNWAIAIGRDKGKMGMIWQGE